MSHSDTAPVPKTSAWVCVVVSLSHTTQHCSCVSQRQSRTSGRHVSARPRDTAPWASDHPDSHTPRTPARVTQPHASDPCMSVHRSDAALHDPAQRLFVCLSVCATGPAASDKCVCLRVTQAHVPLRCPCHTRASGLCVPHSATAAVPRRSVCACVRV